MCCKASYYVDNINIIQYTNWGGSDFGNLFGSGLVCGFWGLLNVGGFGVPAPLCRLPRLYLRSGGMAVFPRGWGPWDFLCLLGLGSSGLLVLELISGVRVTLMCIYIHMKYHVYFKIVIINLCSIYHFILFLVWFCSDTNILQMAQSGHLLQPALPLPMHLSIIIYTRLTLQCIEFISHQHQFCLFSYLIIT